MEIFAFQRLVRLAHFSKQSYALAAPFPHIVVDNVANPEFLSACGRSFPPPDDQRWFDYPNDRNQNSKQTISRQTDMPREVDQLFCALNSRPFIDFVESITGIPNLITDPSLYGAGMHQVGIGGRLGIHVDHDFNPNLNLYRRVTLLLYVSDWRREFQGDLELWEGYSDKCGDHLLNRVSTIAPLFNRMVIFSNSEHSFHGHPEPVRCPSGQFRKSLAVFYLSDVPDPSFALTEHHKARFV